MYRYAVGKAPSGNGNWAFKIGSDDIKKDPSRIFWVRGMYIEAKQKALKEA